MTYSLGFLAPTARELQLSFAAAASEGPAGQERWTDPWLTPAARPGELSAAAIDAAADILGMRCQ